VIHDGIGMILSFVFDC